VTESGAIAVLPKPLNLEYLEIALSAVAETLPAREEALGSVT
jgi:hypothetical protein